MVTSNSIIKKITLIVFSIFILSCSSQTVQEGKDDNVAKEIKSKSIEKNEAHEKPNTKSDYQTYISSLPKIKLPMEFSAATFPLGPATDYEESLFKKFRYKFTSEPVGIVYQSDDYVILMDQSIGDIGPVPFFTLFNHAGEKLDSIAILDKTGEDMGYESMEYVRIEPPFNVSVRDTTTITEYDDQDMEIHGSSVTSSSLVKYSIIENGKFVKSEL